MKIGLVCPYDITKGGGVYEIVRAMCDKLNERGHDAKIITPQPRDYSKADMRNVIFVGNSTDFKSPLHTTTQVSASISTDAIDAMLAAEQFDILHFHEPWVPVVSRQILNRSRCVNMATFHANIPQTIMSQTVVRTFTPYLRAVLKNLDVLTAVSEAAAEYVGTMTDQPIAIIPNGIDLQVFTKPKLEAQAAPKENKMILYIGRLERRKGVKHLLRAYQRLVAERTDVELVIAGDGPDREKLQVMADELNLPNVTFLGYVTDQEKHDLLQTADLFCSPAIFGESFGLVLLEAMASGIPVVAGNNAGYSSVMQELGAVSLVNPADPAEFSRRLSLLLYEEKLRKIWKDWAKGYIKQFSYPLIIDQYEEAYAAAIEAHQENLALQSN